MSNVGAPSGRYDHTVVWTGTEFIVWGGRGDWQSPIGYPALDTGGRYDLGTDTWTPTSMVAVPPGRENHVVVWTGNEMIVWGGVDCGTALDTGGRYVRGCPDL